MTDGESKIERRMHELERAQQLYINEIGHLQAKVGELGSEVERLHAELQHRRGVRAAMHGLYRALDDTIIARIDRRGFARKSSKRQLPAIPASVLASRDMDELMTAAEQYDRRAYFRRRASRSGMRLQYRIASKLYRLARDAALAGVRGAYHVARKVMR